MCQICDMTRCPITCPNYEDRQEDKPITTCDRCGETIYEGDTIYIDGSLTYCNCIKEMTTSEWVDFVGLTTEIAR